MLSGFSPHFAVVGLLFAATAASAAPLNLTRVTSGLASPVFVTAAPGNNAHLYVVEQHSGQIRVVDRATGVVSAEAFHTVPGISQGGEQGLLGLSFHPEYATNGYFYVNYTDANGDTQVERFSRSASDSLKSAVGSGHKIMSIAQPFSNHNAGWLGFSPRDGYLYIATGDGGAGYDPDGHAQRITDDKLGKILRVDVNADDFVADDTRNYAVPGSNPFVGGVGDDEIWAFGLRNPWRASFDRTTGDLYIGDVGQDMREEINFQAATSGGGENYGWRIREGTIATPFIGGVAPPGSIEPVFDYSHSEGSSVTGGYVYRGSDPSLLGQYFFADFISGKVWSMAQDGGGAWQVTDWSDNIALSDLSGLMLDRSNLGNISSFGEDIFGELYVLDYDGDLYRVALVPLPTGVTLMGTGLALLLRRRRTRGIA
jgi:glucose/arabinose dehydrogenase